MKKLIFIFAMAFAASFAMAQSNVATTSQVGNNQNATINQIGESHYGTIDQNGSWNKAFIEQSADLIPNDRRGIDIGSATVSQNGIDNLVRLDQRAFYGDAYATISQTGNSNKVYGVTESDNFKQNHGDNTIDVFMWGNGNTLKTLVSEGQKNHNYFKLKAVGNDNTTAMQQEYGWADVDINGNENNVTVKQYSGTPTNLVPWNVAEVDILGSSNMVNIDQKDLGNYAKVYINGSSNNSSIVQTGGM